MKTVLKLNKVSPTIADRLIDSEYLSPDMSADEVFLRLRFYYQEFPLLLQIPPSLLPSYLEKATCASLINVLSTKPTVVTPTMVSEAIGVQLKYIEKLVKSIGLKKLRIPPENLLYGFDGKFYAPQDMIKLLKKLAADIETGRVIPHESNRHVSRILTGLEIMHPEGIDGTNSAKKLFETECQKLLNPPTQDKVLTYETLDYSKLDWRAVCRQPAFKHLRQLYDCPNNEYLSEYLTAGDNERTLKLLSDLAVKAEKHYNGGKQSESVEDTSPVKAPPRESKSQKTYKTVSRMMRAMPRQDLFDFIEVHNSWYSAGALSTVEEFVKRTRDLAVDVLQYGAPGGNVFLDTKNAYRLHGCPEKFSFDNQKWEPKDFFMDFNISFDKMIKPFHRDNLHGADVLAVGSHAIIEFFDLMVKYVGDPNIKPQ